jgi:uroporphyrinogen decarboxylase
MNINFQNALKSVPQSIPPIWFMRQAGRYHDHYQELKKKHSFVELCKTPELAAATAMGPMREFDFDVSIFFSDLLFPLEALGMGLEYSPGPKLGWHLRDESDLKEFRSVAEALPYLEFQKLALAATRAELPAHKSLLGFVGGPWTLFTYAVAGGHSGDLRDVKERMHLFAPFCEIMVPLLIENIRLQKSSGPDAIMIFDTAAGELSPGLYLTHVLPQLDKMRSAFPGLLGYYSKMTSPDHLDHSSFSDSSTWAGIGFDHRWDMAKYLKHRTSKKKNRGFVQGNFDQALLFCEPAEFESRVKLYLKPLLELSLEERSGWVCGLGHGVLQHTPQGNVKRFVELVRETFAKNSGG